MTTPLGRLPSPIKDHQNPGTSPQKTSLPLRTPLSDATSLNGRVAKSFEEKTPATICLDNLVFTDRHLTDCHAASSTALKTPPPKTFPFPLTGRPSPSTEVSSRILRSYSPCRRLSFGASVLSPAASAPQGEQDPLFMGLVNCFLKGIPAIEANLRAERLIKSTDSKLVENPNDTIALATKAFALIVRGEVADFAEVFHRTDLENVKKTVEIYTHVLKKAEIAFKENPSNLIALIIKTGALGLIGQFKQDMASEDPSLYEQDELRTCHERTLASAEELLAKDSNHLTGIFMKAQALTFLGRSEEVAETLTSAMKSHFQSAILWMLFTTFYYYEDNLEKALEAVTEAIAIEPKYFFAQAVRLDLLGQMEDKEGFLKAKQDAEKYLLPDHPMIQEIVNKYSLSF